MTFYEPDKPKKRRNWAAIPKTPIIPAIPPDASSYRLDSFTPLVINTPDSSTASTSSIPPQPLPLESPFQDLLSQAGPYLKDPGSSRIHPVPQTRFQKVDDILELCSEKFDSLGEFLDALFHSVSRRSEDPHSQMHINMIVTFLGGRSTFRTVNIVEKMHSHCYSIPHGQLACKSELDLAFDAQVDPHTIHYARPALSIWALRIVGQRSRSEIESLTRDDPGNPEFRVHLIAATKPQLVDHQKLVAWDNM